jgi:hypothetical protein
MFRFQRQQTYQNNKLLVEAFIFILARFLFGKHQNCPNQILRTILTILLKENSKHRSEPIGVIHTEGFLINSRGVKSLYFNRCRGRGTPHFEKRVYTSHILDKIVKVNLCVLLYLELIIHFFSCKLSQGSTLQWWTSLLFTYRTTGTVTWTSYSYY